MPACVSPEIESRLLMAFRRAAEDVPAYRQLLEEHGVAVDAVVDAASFSRACPLLNKRNTFDRFPVAALCAGGTLGNLAGVLTSSGHGGRFSFGLIDRADVAINTEFTDRALDALFGIHSRSTLAINCLPMGVGFSSNVMTMATTSVREDMAVALVEAFGSAYDQILLVGDPLFMNRLVSHAEERGLDWRRFRVNVVLGEEIFGERFRAYLAGRLGRDLDRPEGGTILSSFGVGELGLHLCYETPSTVALRRRAATDQAFARDLLGIDAANGALPMVMVFTAERSFIEIVDPDPAGYGLMTLSMLDAQLTLPLLRYQTGDVARLLDAETVSDVAARHGVVLPGDVPPTLVALTGRTKEALPNGSHVGVYKDALYANPAVASGLTGAFRLVFDGEEGRPRAAERLPSCEMHVQMAPGRTPDRFTESAILDALAEPVRPSRLVLWPYAGFPFGMTLDYERKFSYT